MNPDKYTFSASEKEAKAIDEFKLKHSKKCKMKIRWFKYIFIPNGIGTAVYIQCSCGKEKDVSDHEW